MQFITMTVGFLLGFCIVGKRGKHDGKEMLINNNPELLTDKDIMAIRKGYTQDYFRLCNELGLSPQSRAKLGSLSLQKDQQNNDVLLKILEGGAG